MEILRQRAIGTQRKKQLSLSEKAGEIILVWMDLP